jgi:hypothetical protein
MSNMAVILKFLEPVTGSTFRLNNLADYVIKKQNV